MEFYKDRKGDLYIVYIDLEKEYDRVLREILCRCLDKKGVPVAYMRAVKDMYDGVRTRVRTLVGIMDGFLIDIGLH